MRTTIFIATASLLSGCRYLQDDLDEATDCLHEESARPLVMVTQEPDISMEVPTEAVQGPEPWEDGGKVWVEAWDCVDLSWWNPTPPRKVVQVWVDETECELYEKIFVETYDCGSHEGSDAPFRDWDGDGVTAWDGDPDDSDPEVF